MPKLKTGRSGGQLKVRDWLVRFSPWALGQTTRRYGLQPRIFVTNPWHAMRHAINKYGCSDTKSDALSFIEHAEGYYKAASLGEVGVVKPVLFYYSFLNIAKAFSLYKGIRNDYSKARHGLSEKCGKVEISSAFLEAYPSSKTNANIFADFLQAASGQVITSNHVYAIPHLLPQILQGHRLWCMSSSGQQERFYHIEVISIQDNKARREVWIDMLFPREDLSRHALSCKQLLLLSNLKGKYERVKTPKPGRRDYIKFQSVDSVSYRQRPADAVPKAIAGLKPHLWTNVLSIPPYRKYYLYLCPASETRSLLPQILSIYSVFYYLSSVTRYRPNSYQAILDGNHGTQIQEIIANVPQQFIYLVASEFAEQEIVKPALI